MRPIIPKAVTLAGVLGMFTAAAVAFLHKQPALGAMQLYYVREMLAALLLFSIGFAVVSVLLLILLLLDRVLYPVAAWTGSHMVHVAVQLHKGWVLIESLGRKQFHRSEQFVDR